MFRRTWTHPRADRLWGAVTLVGVIGIALWGNLAPEVEAEFFFSEDDPQLRASLALDGTYPSPPQIILRVASPDTRAPEYRTRIGELTAALTEVEGIVAVYSITTDDALRSPLWGRLLLTPDSTATNLIARTEGGEAGRLLPEVEDVITRFTAPDFAIVASGVPVIVELIRRSLLRDLAVFSLAAFVAFGLLGLAIYRDVRVVAGTLTACVLACVVTLTAIQAFGISIGLLTANIVTIVFVLTLSHTVFLTANWRTALSTDATPDADAGADHVSEAVAHTREGSFWAMTTTLLGFLSLLVASARPLRELGIAGALGTVTAIVVAYAVYPAFLAGAERRNGMGGGQARLATLPLPRRPMVLVPIVLAILVAGTGVFGLNTDPGLLTYFSPDGAVRPGLESIDADGGSSTLKVEIRDTNGAAIHEPDAYDRMWDLQRALEADPAVGVVVSPAVLLAHARTQPLARFLPNSVLLTILESPALDQIGLSFVTADRSTALFFLRMREGVQGDSRAAVMERLVGYASDAGFDTPRVGGLYDLQRQLGSLIRESLRIGLFGLLILFIGVAWAVSRRIRVTALMVAWLTGIPLVVLGVFGHFGLAVDIITSPAANVALAMGVDSMIHLIVRARSLSGGGSVAGPALSRARQELARPILTATGIICLGFGIFVLSDFPPTQRFGIAVILGTATAAVIALIGLPLAAGVEERPRTATG